MGVPSIAANCPAGKLLIVTEYELDTASGRVPLLALTAKVDIPAVVGMPLSSPALDKFKPAGKLPLATFHVIGFVPEAVN
jgi:hypothetical protein